MDSSVTVRSIYNTLESFVSTSEPQHCFIIHYMPTIETLDPRLQNIYKGMRPPGTPKYGLGYIEQCDQVIPDFRFTNPLPESINRPSIDEIHKFHSIMKGCPRESIEEVWIKKMLNWDLFTHPETSDFNISTSDEEKTRLSKDWQNYISEKDTWISFYEWKRITHNLKVQMMEGGETSPRHKWKSLEGQTVESTSTFPPFKGIVLEDNNRQVRVVPLVLAEEAIQLTGVDKKVQSLSKQINWTNTALRGMATHTFVTNNYARKGHIRDLQVSTNTIVQSINQINDKVVDVQEKVDKTIDVVTHKSQESTQHHEELMEGLGEAFSTMGKTLLEIKQKDHIPDKPIPHSFILPNPPISIVSPIYKPSEMTIEKKFPHHFPKTQDEPESSKNNLSLVSIQKPSFEDLPHHVSRPPAPDLLGKGKMPESQTFAEDWFPKWNIDNLLDRSDKC
jgi:hypothetical protein